MKRPVFTSTPTLFPPVSRYPGAHHDDISAVVMALILLRDASGIEMGLSIAPPRHAHYAATILDATSVVGDHTVTRAWSCRRRLPTPKCHWTPGEIGSCRSLRDAPLSVPFRLWASPELLVTTLSQGVGFPLPEIILIGI